MLFHRTNNFILPVYLYQRDIKPDVINDIIDHSYDLIHILKDLNFRINDLRTTTSKIKIEDDFIHISKDLFNSLDDIKIIYNDIKKFI